MIFSQNSKRISISNLLNAVIEKYTYFAKYVRNQGTAYISDVT